MREYSSAGKSVAPPWLTPPDAARRAPSPVAACQLAAIFTARIFPKRPAIGAARVEDVLPARAVKRALESWLCAPVDHQRVWLQRGRIAGSTAIGEPRAVVTEGCTLTPDAAGRQHISVTLLERAATHAIPALLALGRAILPEAPPHERRRVQDVLSRGAER